MRKDMAVESGAESHSNSPARWVAGGNIGKRVKVALANMLSVRGYRCRERDGRRPDGSLRYRGFMVLLPPAKTRKTRWDGPTSMSPRPSARWPGS